MGERSASTGVQPFDVERFRAGMDVELEHGTRDADTDVSGDDPVVTGRIALAQLCELSDSNTRLAQMEAEPGKGAAEVRYGRARGDALGSGWLSRTHPAS